MDTSTSSSTAIVASNSGGIITSPLNGNKTGSMCKRIRESYLKDYEKNADKLDIINDLTNEQNSLFVTNKQELKTFVKTDGLNLPAMFCFAFKENSREYKKKDGKSATISSRSFKCIIGNIRGVNLPDGQIKGDHIEVKVEENDFYKIYQNKGYMFSSAPFEDIEFGHIVMLQNVKVTKSKGRYFLNVTKIIPGHLSTSYYTSHLTTLLIESGISNDYLPRCETKFIESDKSTKHGYDAIIVVTDPPNPSVVDKAYTSYATYQRLTNEKDWKFTSKNGNILPIFRGTYNVIQWKEKFDKDNIEKIYLETLAYTNSISPFGILNVDAWYELGPHIIKNSPYIIIGKVDVKATNSLAANFDEKLKEKGLYAYGISLGAEGILVNVPSVYKDIGIPVTKEYTLEYSKFFGQVQRPYNEPNPVVVCLSESKDDVKMLLDEKNIEIRVILPVSWDLDQLSIIEKLTPEQGTEFLKIISAPPRPGGAKKVVPDSNPASKLNINLEPSVVKYFFVIYNDRLNMNSTEFQKFVNGQERQSLGNIIMSNRVIEEEDEMNLPAIYDDGTVKEDEDEDEDEMHERKSQKIM